MRGCDSPCRYLPHPRLLQILRPPLRHIFQAFTATTFRWCQCFPQMDSVEVFVFSSFLKPPGLYLTGTLLRHEPPPITSRPSFTLSLIVSTHSQSYYSNLNQRWNIFAAGPLLNFSSLNKLNLLLKIEKNYFFENANLE